MLAERLNLHMRVHEWGASETRTCGTGACAAVAADLLRQGTDPTEPRRTERYAVGVPGGRLHVALQPDGDFELSGSARITATGMARLHDAP
ncbi:hypothetical protein [Streptomyces sp. MMG1121]|uniref:hypothetical protein n=1 Tax=Streptomyces sp. MMG1121 TaxID=1415544 RepID=UPI003B641F47